MSNVKNKVVSMLLSSQAFLAARFSLFFVLKPLSQDHTCVRAAAGWEVWALGPHFGLSKGDRRGKTPCHSSYTVSRDVTCLCHFRRGSFSVSSGSAGVFFCCYWGIFAPQKSVFGWQVTKAVEDSSLRAVWCSLKICLYVLLNLPARCW